MQPLFTHIRRITSGVRWIPEVDGLRFLAIFAVVLYHVEQQLQFKSGRALIIQHWYALIFRFVSNGSRGIELFFVVSGFMLGLPFARHALLGQPCSSIAHYYARRLTRLEPPYLINLVVLSVAAVIYEHRGLAEVARHFVATALYIHELLFKRVSTINGVTWTLEIEIQFYLIVPLLALFYRIRDAAMRRGSMVTAAAVFVVAEQLSIAKDFWGSPEACIYNSVFFYLQFFLTGMLLSDVYLIMLPRRRPNRAWDVASLCCWTLYFFENVSWDAALLPVLLFVSFIGAFKGVYFARLFRMEATAVIGGMCYSIYLWHFFLIAIFFKFTKHLLLGNDALTNLMLQCLLLLPPVLFFSATLFVLAERPFMLPRWPQKLLSKAKAAAG